MSLKKSIAIGAIWMILLKVVIRSIGLISTVILARILTPADYGMVAIGMSVYVLFEMLAAFGFDTALVKKKELTKDDYDSAWTARFICYVILSILLALSADLAEIFYKKEGIAPIMYAFSFMMFLSGFENIAIVDLRRDLQFNKEFIYNVSNKMVGFCVTIPLAFYLKSYWALIIGSISLRFSSVILGYIFRPYIPSICFKQIGNILGFSKWILFNNLVLYLRKQIPNLILGRYSTTESVGVFNLSLELSRVSTQELIAAMNRPVYSGYSKLSGELKGLYNSFLRVIGLQSLIVLPLGFAVAALSEYVVQIILGDKWIDVIIPLSLIAISTAIVSITSSVQYLYFVIDKPKLGFLLSVVGFTIYLPLALILGIDTGLMGLVYAHFITSIAMSIINLLFVSYIFREKYILVCKKVYRPLFSSILMYIFMSQYFIPIIKENFQSQVLQLSIYLPVTLLVYLSLLFVFWLISGDSKSSESDVFEIIKSIYFNVVKKILSSV